MARAVRAVVLAATLGWLAVAGVLQEDLATEMMEYSEVLAMDKSECEPAGHFWCGSFMACLEAAADCPICPPGCMEWAAGSLRLNCTTGSVEAPGIWDSPGYCSQLSTDLQASWAYYTRCAADEGLIYCPTLETCFSPLEKGCPFCPLQFCSLYASGPLVVSCITGLAEPFYPVNETGQSIRGAVPRCLKIKIIIRPNVIVGAVPPATPPMPPPPANFIALTSPPTSSYTQRNPPTESSQRNPPPPSGISSPLLGHAALTWWKAVVIAAAADILLLTGAGIAWRLVRKRFPFKTLNGTEPSLLQ
jgi:hypothetical protein